MLVKIHSALYINTDHIIRIEEERDVDSYKYSLIAYMSDGRKVRIGQDTADKLSYMEIDSMTKVISNETEQ